MIELTITNKDFKKNIDRFIRQSDTGFKKALLKSTNEMVKIAKLKVRNYIRGSKVKSSNLVNNINSRITNQGLTGEVISGASYSEAFEKGTKSHPISVRNKRVLAGPYRGRPTGWNVNEKSKAMGYATYGKKVRHPGTKPHPFMYPAWKYAIDFFENEMRKILK